LATCQLRTARYSEETEGRFQVGIDRFYVSLGNLSLIIVEGPDLLEVDANTQKSLYTVLRALMR